MGKVSKNIFYVLMAVIVLITSNGIILASHTCLKNSNTKVSLFQNKSCCGKTKKTCESTETKAVKSNCCNSSVSYHKVNVNTVPVQKPASNEQIAVAPELTLISIRGFNTLESPVNVKPPLLQH